MLGQVFFTIFHGVVAVLLPLLGVVVTVALLVYAAYVRWVDVPQKVLLSRRALIVLCVVALLCDAWLALRLYLPQRARQAWQDTAAVRASRERFTLPQDFQYGELVIPAGSRIVRKDPFDQGEPDRPLALHGLEAVRFAQPVQVAGVWASAVQLHPLRVELAQDQRLGPIHRFDAANDRWVVNRVVPALACKKGQLAIFHVPHIAYDVQAELAKPPPDGPDARFLPSQWLFRQCEVGAPVALEPAS